MNIYKSFLFALMTSSLLVACGQKGDDTKLDEAGSAAKAKISSTSDRVATTRDDYVEPKSTMVLAATTSSETARFHYISGWEAFEMGRFNEAYDRFNMATAMDSSFAIGHFMAALSAPSTEVFASNLAKASKHAPATSQGEQLMIKAFERGFAGDQEGQVDAMRELTSLHPDSPRAWVLLAQAHGNQNDAASALTALNKALEIDPNFAMAHMQLGNNYMFLDPKDYDKAEAHIKKAVDIAPNEPNPYDLLGDVHRAQGNLKAAYEDYTKVAELSPEQGSGLQQRGHVNSFLGEYEAARADYTLAAELEDKRGTNNGPIFLVFRAYVSLHEGDLSAAVKELKTLASDVKNLDMEGTTDVRINALSNVALIATHRGDDVAGREAIDEVAALMRQQADEVGTDEFRSAQEATISYLEGMLAARMGDMEGAKAKADEFAKHVESNTNPRKLERMHEIQGMASFYKDDFESAVEHLAQGDVVNNMYTKYMLAVAHERHGDADEAGKLFNELAVWNFNGPGYALTRRAVLEKVSQQ